MYLCWGSIWHIIYFPFIAYIPSSWTNEEKKSNISCQISLDYDVSGCSYFQRDKETRLFRGETSHDLNPDHQSESDASLDSSQTDNFSDFLSFGQAFCSVFLSLGFYYAFLWLDRSYGFGEENHSGSVNLIA